MNLTLNSTEESFSSFPAAASCAKCAQFRASAASSAGEFCACVDSPEASAEAARVVGETRFDVDGDWALKRLAPSIVMVTVAVSTKS